MSLRVSRAFLQKCAGHSQKVPPRRQRHLQPKIRAGAPPSQEKFSQPEQTSSWNLAIWMRVWPLCPLHRVTQDSKYSSLDGR